MIVVAVLSLVLLAFTRGSDDVKLHGVKADDPGKTSMILSFFLEKNNTSVLFCYDPLSQLFCH